MNKRLMWFIGGFMMTIGIYGLYIIFETIYYEFVR